MSVKESFFALKVKWEAITVPGIEGPLYVRGLSVGERHALDEDCVTGTGKDMKRDYAKYRPALIRLTLETADGTPVFTKADDAAIAALPAEIMEPIFDVAVRLGGLGVKSEASIAGNSGAGQDAGKPSPSPNG